MTVSVKSDISWKVSVLFKDSKSANDAKKLIDAFLVQMKKAKEMPSAVKDTIESTEYKVSGNRLESDGTYETAKLIKLIKALQNGKF